MTELENKYFDLLTRYEDAVRAIEGPVTMNEPGGQIEVGWKPNEEPLTIIREAHEDAIQAYEDTCLVCDGSGYGQSAEPGRSVCTSCRGAGWKREAS